MKNMRKRMREKEGGQGGRRVEWEKGDSRKGSKQKREHSGKGEK